MPAHAPEPSLVGLDVVGHFGWRDLPMQGLLILLPLDDSVESTLDLLAREGESWPQHFQPMDQMLLRQQGIGVQLGLQGLTWILQESLPASIPATSTPSLWPSHLATEAAWPWQRVTNEVEVVAMT